MEYIFKNNTYLTIPKDDWKNRIEVELGDSKQPDFKPQVKIMRWDNEVNFSARLVHNESNPQVTTEADKIKWVGSKIEAHFYEVPDSIDCPEGGYEFEVILKEKPATNKIEFTLNTKGVNFHYQPPLNQEKLPPDGMRATEIEVFDKDNNRVAYRPENIVGSYAVYCSENKINLVGGKLYKIGKVGHIFRPKIIDSIGTEVWGELNIDIGKEILSITIPQDFIDKAVYPIIIDPTFGNTTQTASGGNIQNYLRGSHYLISEAGTGTSLTFYISAKYSTGNAKAAAYVYTNDSAAGALLSGTEQVSVTAAGAYTVNFTGSPSFSVNTQYFLMA